MSALIKKWITNRLGIIVDINTRYFGKHVCDGRLIAQLLHAYDIINADQLQTIVATEDPRLALQNLQYISNWLRYIKVECNPEVMQEIANSNGSTAVRLFYQLFLALESKDKVYFVTQQKEREKAVGNNRFEILNVRQQLSVPKQRPFNPLSKPLIQHEEVINWYRKKYEQIEKQLIRTKKQYTKQISDAKKKLSFAAVPKNVQSRESEYETFQNDLQDFEKKYMEESRDWTYEELEQLMRKAQNMEIPGLDLEVANRYVSMIKKQFRKRAADEKAKSKLQMMLVNDLWNKVMEKQEEEFDNLITAKTLKQSEYEKQMITKCFDVREQIKVIADNRKMVENLVAKKREDEFSRAVLEQQDIKNREVEKYYFEKERVQELHKRLYAEKLRLKYMRHYEFCRNIFNAFVDVAVKVAQYTADLKEEVPKKALDEWKTLFIKDEPIFEKTKDLQKLIPTSDEVEEIVALEMKRQEVLNESDFQTYLSFSGEWDLFSLIPDFEQPEQIIENGLFVVGHIVHRLFLIKYPIPLPPPPADIPPFKVLVCITGVKEFGLLPVLQELLLKPQIKIIEIPNAINYCLESYRNEMIGVADITVVLQNETNISLFPKPDTSQRVSQPVDPKNGKSVELARQAKEAHVEEPFSEKATQTPKKIPDEETVGSLGEAALLGKYAYEVMSLGVPLNDHILVAMLVVYLKTLTEWKGWALLNYPVTMNQAAILESVITGHYVPIIETEYDDMDDLVDYPTRGNFSTRNMHQLASFKDSLLVPNPYKPPGSDIHKTFLTAFISIKHSVGKAEKDEEFEFLSEDAPPLEKFYTDQGVNYALYYNVFDFEVIKRLGKLIIGDYQLPLKSSLDLFGDTVTEMAGKFGSKASGKLDSRKTYIIPENTSLVCDEENAAPSLEEESVIVLPGEYNYIYVDLPIYDSLGYALATIWENIEIIYVNDTKQLFFIKRSHRDTLVPYTVYIRKHMKEYIERPDNKQDIVYKFQKMYNDLEEDIRDDEEVQAELHCRLTEMKDQLYSISDNRMNEAENERRRIIYENWISEHMIVLTNIFISLMQVEVDRCADTTQFIQDYYFTMLGKKMDPNERPQKLELPKVETIKRQEFGDGDNVVSYKMPRQYTDVGIMINNSVANAMIVPETVDIESIPVISFIHNNSSLAMVQIDQWAAKMVKVIQDNQVAYNPAKKKPEEGVNPQDIIRLFEEWMCAIDSEISRTRLRINAIRYKAEKSLAEVLMCGQNLFHSLYKEIAVRFDREIKSITNLCSLIGIAIEERIKFQTELVLEGDEFLVNMNTFLYPDKPTPPPTPSKERLSDGDFTVDQLTRLYEIFFDLAPYGSIPERTLIYLIEDLVTQNAEDGFRDSVPELWTKMNPANIEELLSEIFGDTEFVDWRDFIILNMSIPFPTEQQLLKAWLTYGLFDENKHELIDRETYNKVTLWFELSSQKPKPVYCDSNFSDVNTATVSTNSSVEENIRNKRIKDLLFSMFEAKKDQINYTGMLLAFCKDYEPTAGLGKALALALRSMVCWNSYEGMVYLQKIEEERLAEEMRLMNQNEESGECFCGMTDIFSYNPESNLTESAVTSKTSSSFVGKDFNHGNVEMVEEEATPERGYIGLSLLHMYSDEELAVYKERAYLIPFEATLVTMAALFPWHIRTKCIENNSLRGLIEQVFLDLKPDENGCVRPWEFLNHPRIQEIMMFYHKFLIVHPTDIIRKLLQVNEKVHYAN